MKYQDSQYEKRGRQSLFCVLFLMGVLVSALSLGGIRIYGLYLEHKLADYTMRIETAGNKYATLEEYHASLLSPSRIYNYAKSELNMITATEVETIKLISDSYKGSEVASASGGSKNGGRVSASAGGFVGAANAKE
jgi:cell division protein FtsL